MISAMTARVPMSLPENRLFWPVVVSVRAATAVEPCATAVMSLTALSRGADDIGVEQLHHAESDGEDEDERDRGQRRGGVDAAVQLLDHQDRDGGGAIGSAGKDEWQVEHPQHVQGAEDHRYRQRRL